MPRVKRLIPPDGYLHVMCRGNNKQFIFHSPTDYRCYYNLLYELREENNIKINHYCLMNNHVHLIIHVVPQSNIARYMKQVNLRYTCHYRRKYGYAGHLWQDRYKSIIIESGSYMLQCGKYIELNPVKAAIVEHPREFKYSSYLYYAYGKKDKLIEEDPEYIGIAKNENERKKEYRDFVIEKEIGEMFAKNRYVGTSRFIKKMEEYYDIKNTNKVRGRRKKNRP